MTCRRDTITKIQIFLLEGPNESFYNTFFYQERIRMRVGHIDCQQRKTDKQQGGAAPHQPTTFTMGDSICAEARAPHSPSPLHQQQKHPIPSLTQGGI